MLSYRCELSITTLSFLSESTLLLWPLDILLLLPVSTFDFLLGDLKIYASITN